MAEFSFALSGWNQSLEIDPAKIEGKGSAAAPRLHIPCVWIFNPTGTRDGRFFYVQYALGTLTIPNAREDIARAIIRINFSMRGGGRSAAHRPVEFDLSPKLVEHIEAARKGDQPLTLSFGVYGVEGREITADGQRIAVLLAEVTEAQLHIHLTIPQSQWVQKILPAIGLPPTCLVELPLENPLFPKESSVAATELRAALDYFRNGDYDKVVAHCRAAFEPFRKALPGLKEAIGSKTEFEWISDSADATWTWLDIMLRRLQALSSKTHHAPSLGHFSREDARTVLMITTALVSYANRVPGNYKK